MILNKLFLWDVIKHSMTDPKIHLLANNKKENLEYNFQSGIYSLPESPPNQGAPPWGISNFFLLNKEKKNYRCPQNAWGKRDEWALNLRIRYFHDDGQIMCHLPCAKTPRLRYSRGLAHENAFSLACLAPYVRRASGLVPP